MRRASLLVLIAVLFVSPHCGRARGDEQDPLVKEAEDDFVGYLRIDTSNPPGNETAGAKFLQQLLAKEGIPATLTGSDPKRQSLVARLRSGTSAKALLLLHHIDVVPVAPGEWTRPAFAGLRSAGYFWGRGALDIKSLGIAELMAMIDLKRRHVPLTRDVVFAAVADEELGGTHGCRELLDTHPEFFANVGYVLNEGGYNDTIVDRVAFWGIEVQQKVPLFLRVTMRGAAGHAASPPDDGGTIARLIAALQTIESIETPYRLTPAVARYFHALGGTKRDERGEVMRAMAEPLDVVRIKRVLSPGYRALLHDTIAITRVNGGACVNCLPALATADLDIRLLPDETTDPMLANVRAAAGKDADVSVILAGAPMPESPSDTDLFRTLSAAFTKSDPGSAVAPVVGAGTSDSRFFRQRGIVAYGIAPFKVNYYDAETVHGSDERIRERFFDDGVRLMREIVRSFCAAGNSGLRTED